MEVYEAIRRMRERSEEGEAFSFSFMSYSYTRNKSEGVVEVQNARLRKQSTVDKNHFAGIMLNFINLDTLEYGMCYQVLLLTYEGEELELL